jgi:hypothetical protein
MDEAVGKRKFRSFIRRNVKMSDDLMPVIIILSIAGELARARRCSIFFAQRIASRHEKKNERTV